MRDAHRRSARVHGSPTRCELCLQRLDLHLLRLPSVLLLLLLHLLLMVLRSALRLLLQIRNLRECGLHLCVGGIRLFDIHGVECSVTRKRNQM